MAEGLAPTLDVLTSFAITETGENLDPLYSIGSVVTPHGLASLVIEDLARMCTYVLVEDAPTGQVRRSASMPCPYSAGTSGSQANEGLAEGTTLIGYDPANDAVIACLFAREDNPVLLSLDARSGEPRWTITVADLGLLVAPTDPLQAVDIGILNGWYCEGSSLDLERGRAVVGVSRFGGSHVIASVALVDGSVVWSRQAPAAVFGGTPLVPAGLDAATACAEFYSTGLTREGIVAIGLACTKGPEGGAVWLTHDGEVIGGHAAAARGRAFLGSWGVAERDGILAALVGEEVLLIDPLVVEPVRIPVRIDAGALTAYSLPLAWWGDHLLVPMDTVLTDYDPAGARGARWTWDDPAGWRLEDVVIAPPSDVYVLASRHTEKSDEAALFRLDLSTGAVVQRLPLPVTLFSAPTEASLKTRSNDIVFFGRLIPLGDGGIAMVSERGEVVVLGAAAAELLPRVTPDNAYPAVGEAISVEVEPAAGIRPVALVVSWGDGAVDQAAVGVAIAHEFASAGLYTVRATAIYPDNRTATSEAQVHVGGTPPPQLSFMQRAFAPDRAETTWGIFGLVVTLAGATVALAERRRRRGKLGEEIRALEHVKEQARRDLPGAMRSLHLFHERIQREHAAGTLDDAQFGVLELRESRLRTQLRNRVLGAVAGRVTPRFQQALDAALEDGVLEPNEATRLRDALAHERNLDDAERAQLAALFDGWARGGARSPERAETAERAEGTGVRTGAPSAEGTGARTPAPSSPDDPPREGSS